MFARILLLCLVATTTTAIAEEITITQRNKAFDIEEVTAKVGDTIAFLNDDPFYHNIFSISDTLVFDLGSYPRGQARKVTLKQAGDIEVECALHPTMQMIIHVTD